LCLKNRKTANPTLYLITRSDIYIYTLIHEASEINGIPYIMDCDEEEAENILEYET